MEKINKIIKQIQAVQFNEEGIMSDSGMRTLDSSIKELKSLQIAEPVPEPKPVNAEEDIDLKSIEAKIDDALESRPPQPDQVKEEEVEQVACDEMQQDWNDLAYQQVYHDGFKDGAKWMQKRLNK